MHNDPLPQPPIEGQTRALVPVGSEEADGGGARVRSHAAFVTQLIACSRGLPAYRARRRADPREASLRYAEREAAPSPRTGRDRLL
ncbi:MAG: hypothetical protein MEP57_03550 [Microvirga sp.]|nr:hypothetical protein [Microvirga sp.]